MESRIGRLECRGGVLQSRERDHDGRPEAGRKCREAIARFCDVAKSYLRERRWEERLSTAEMSVWWVMCDANTRERGRGRGKDVTAGTEAK
jgi:hypothetical protein